jgi:hypothetical protein
MDRDSSAPSNPRFAGCLRVVPLLQTLMVGSNTRHSTRRPHHDGGTPWSVPAALRVRVCESCPSCVANAVQIHPPPCEQCRWESQQCPGSLPMHTYPPMRLAGCLSEAHTSGETQTLEARLCASTRLVLANASRSAAGHWSERTRVHHRREASHQHAHGLVGGLPSHHSRLTSGPYTAFHPAHTSRTVAEARENRKPPSCHPAASSTFANSSSGIYAHP